MEPEIGWNSPNGLLTSASGATHTENRVCELPAAAHVHVDDIRRLVFIFPICSQLPQSVEGQPVMFDGRTGIVACAGEYPDAASPEAHWESVLSRRRSFRAIPRPRLRLDEYSSHRGADPDGIYSIEAALIQSYGFDRSAFRCPQGTWVGQDRPDLLAGAGRRLPRIAPGRRVRRRRIASPTHRSVGRQPHHATTLKPREIPA